MNLYFIACTDDNGENQDWFAVAHAPEEAIALWQKDCVYDDTMKPDRVFLVPAIPHGALCTKGPAVINWHSEAKEVWERGDD